MVGCGDAATVAAKVETAVLTEHYRHSVDVKIIFAVFDLGHW